jgi:hypothetical protein
LWGGGTYAQALAGNAPLIIKHNGELTANNATIRGTINATDGEFNGKVSLAGGKILLNKDGSGQLANGSVTWEANGNMNFANGKITITASNGNITLNNVTANNGTFNGVINASGGIRMGARFITQATRSRNLTTSDSFIVVYDITSNITIYLPSNPILGQIIIIKNLSDSYSVTVNANGLSIYQGYEGLNSFNIARGRAYMLMCNVNWFVVGSYEY